MKLVLWLSVAVLGTALLDPSEELATLRSRARTILDARQSLEITPSQARRQVQLLLKDFQAWAKSNDLELQSRTREYRSSEAGHDDSLTADRCPLFFEEELDELCPLDLGRSEVWGGRLVYCRYYCE